MGEVDGVLSRSKPPAIEYIYVNPPWSVVSSPIYSSQTNFNPYGHSAVRYSVPLGEGKYEQKVLLKKIGLN